MRHATPKNQVARSCTTQRKVHRQTYGSDDSVGHAFMGLNPDAADNCWLREALENRTSVICFLGIAPGRYQAMFPAFIAGWDANALKASLAIGLPVQEDVSHQAPIPEAVISAFPETSLERRYALQSVKRRLHQSSLLDAAHIVPDTREKLGQPVIPKGLPLSKIHHAAFDSHRVGIDPEYRLHVSDRLLDKEDGPLLDSLNRHKGAPFIRLTELRTGKIGRGSRCTTSPFEWLVEPGSQPAPDIERGGFSLGC